MPGADGAPGAEPGADGALAELAGAYITRVTLPEGIKKIGNFAFYNATELAELELGSGIDTLGSDAFMNCRSLSRLLLHADPGQKTGLRLLLAQLSSDLEVALSGENGVWAKLLFPEYYESYDEIAPAHIFGRILWGGIPGGDRASARTCSILHSTIRFSRRRVWMNRRQRWDGWHSTACAMRRNFRRRRADFTRSI